MVLQLACAHQVKWRTVAGVAQLAETAGLPLQPASYDSLWNAALQVRPMLPWPQIAPILTTLFPATQCRAVLYPYMLCHALPVLQAGWVTEAVHVFRRGAAIWGVPSQSMYTTIISKLLKLRRRRLPVCQLAFQLWRELHEAHRMSLDSGSVRAGGA